MGMVAVVYAKVLVMAAYLALVFARLYESVVLLFGNPVPAPEICCLLVLITHCLCGSPLRACIVSGRRF